MQNPRPTFVEWFLSGAQLGCLAGGCPRGLQSLEDVPPNSQYDHGPGTCSSVHAELNALLAAARFGISVEGATMYITCEPCPTCARLVQAAGIATVMWPSERSEHATASVPS